MNQEFVNYNLDLKRAKKIGIANSSTEDLGFKCVSCGKHISGQVVRFFAGDVEHVFCYDCQEKNKF